MEDDEEEEDVYFGQFGQYINIRILEEWFCFLFLFFGGNCD